MALPDPSFSEPTTVALEKSRTAKNIVQFSNVNLREYDICLGDNPSVLRGAPISLDWNYKEEELCYSIEDFEKSEHCSLTHRSKSSGDMFAFKHSSLDRLHLLKKLGYSRKEIKEATDNAQRARNQRFETRRHCERADKIKAILNGFSCLFCRMSPDSICDVDKQLGESVSTTSTRNSIDWTTVNTDVTVVWPRNRLQRIRSSSNIVSSDSESNRTRNNTEHKKRRAREIWQERILEQRQKWQARWQRKSCDSLDTARHSAVTFDLGNP